MTSISNAEFLALFRPSISIRRTPNNGRELAKIHSRIAFVTRVLDEVFAGEVVDSPETCSDCGGNLVEVLGHSLCPAQIYGRAILRVIKNRGGRVAGLFALRFRNFESLRGILCRSN